LAPDDVKELQPIVAAPAVSYHLKEKWADYIFFRIGRSLE